MDRVDPRAAIMPLENETKSSASRITVDNRTITYRMNVLQQPARARACGQGAKSSADRRPVDPPPVVELNIFEGENAEKDITFTMNANYFLFATLEHARAIAPGRLSAERDSNPVLTGTPVAGLVYLDRPKQAGYFIFPDLSVRHEGEYRLSFSLFEEIKHPKDEDKVEGGAQRASTSDPHVTHRLEVKSEPFNVFSAKKFPGLTESTSLSRMVAEQGCRVRIRRDVRMRRRDTKDGKDWDEYEDKTGQMRARMSATPDPALYAGHPQHYMDAAPRPRSSSNASHHSMSSVLSRRPSVQEMNAAYAHAQYANPPHTPQQAQMQAASFAAPPPPFPESTSYGMPPPSQYAQPTYQSSSLPAPPPPPAASAAPMYPSHMSAQAQPVHAVQQHDVASMSQHQARPMEYNVAAASRRSSGQMVGPSMNAGYHSSPQTYMSNPPYSMTPESYPRQQHNESAHRPTNQHVALPPISVSQQVIPTTSYTPKPELANGTRKRSHGHVFGDQHHHEPLRQGARPSSVANNYPSAAAAHHFTHPTALSSSCSLVAGGDDDDTDCDVGDFNPATLNPMQYRRADGRQINRALPDQ